MKKFMGVCAIVVVIIGTRGALAAEPDADLEPRLVNDVQSIPADENAPTACPVTGPCCETDCPKAICVSGCETGCVPRICDGYGVPRLAFDVDPLSMHRQIPGESLLFVNGTTTATPLDAAQFSFGNPTGIASSVTRNCSDNDGLELRSMWMGDATASVSYKVPHAPGWTDQRSYQSRLQPAELNIRKHFDWFDGSIGIRYANLKQRSSGVQSRPGETLATTWNTQGNLFGAQVGGYGEAGIYDNSAGTSFAISDNPEPFTPFDFANTSLQLTPHIALRGGYQLLWLDGAVVAGRQVPATGNFNILGQATSHVNSADAIFHQCAKPGLEVTW